MHKEYILVDYYNKHTFIGTAVEIGKEMQGWDHIMIPQSPRDQDDYLLIAKDDIHTTLNFWDVFDIRIIPKQNEKNETEQI